MNIFITSISVLMIIMNFFIMLIIHLMGLTISISHYSCTIQANFAYNFLIGASSFSQEGTQKSSLPSSVDMINKFMPCNVT